MTATLPSPENLKPNPAWASLSFFDRTGWTRMAFGEFAESIGERAEPKDAQEEIYVGLEHLDPQCLHIRRWGKGSDVIGGKLRFRKGDIIFGKRRAYQRKLAVAEFGGICSAHAMVIRARPDKVLPEFLPFLMMSDRFMNRAVEISVGSLSPTITWTTLKRETFDLPPLDQQRRIAEILWAVDDSLQKWQGSELAVSLQRRAIIAEFMADHTERFLRLGDFLEEVQYGSSSKCIIQKGDGLYPVLRIPNVIGEKIDFADLVWSEPTPDVEKYQLEHGDVLIVRTNGNPDYVGRTAVFEGSVYEQCLFASYLIRLRPSPSKLLPQFLHEMLASDKVKRDIRKQVKSSAGNYNLNTEGIRGLSIPVSSLKVQRELLGELTRLSDGLKATRHHLSAVTNLNSSLLNTLFGTIMP